MWGKLIKLVIAWLPTAMFIYWIDPNLIADWLVKDGYLPFLGVVGIGWLYTGWLFELGWQNIIGTIIISWVLLEARLWQVWNIFHGLLGIGWIVYLFLYKKGNSLYIKSKGGKDESINQKNEF